MIKKLKKLLSLKEASSISGYHPDYLSSLIRKKELKGEKIGRSWYVSEDSLKSYLFKRKPSFLRFMSRTRLKKILLFTLLIFLVLILYLCYSSARYQDNEFEIQQKLNQKNEVVSYGD